MTMGSAGDVTRKIMLSHIAHVYYKHKNLEKQTAFLNDFGFYEAKKLDEKIYYRGYSNEPFLYCAIASNEDEFGGAAFVVDSEEDLIYAAATLPDATEIYEMTDAPGGGQCVTFKDPIDGYPFHLVYGQTLMPIQNEPSFPQLEFNYPNDKQRPANQTQRFNKRPSPVHKLGHFGMCVTSFAEAQKFYTTRFNFIPSELVHDKENKMITAFNRLDRGVDLVDHHSFFLFEGPKWHVHHSSFETHDFDTQVLGHDWLRHKNYESCWGVGRHIMGSQIFDYWFDASRFILEHYVDGDLLNASEPPNLIPESPNNLHVWGPDLPPTFMQ